VFHHVVDSTDVCSYKRTALAKPDKILVAGLSTPRRVRWTFRCHDRAERRFLKQLKIILCLSQSHGYTQPHLETATGATMPWTGAKVYSMPDPHLDTVRMHHCMERWRRLQRDGSPFLPGPSP
jgi:hypothetical protein